MSRLINLGNNYLIDSDSILWVKHEGMHTSIFFNTGNWLDLEDKGKDIFDRLKQGCTGANANN